MHNKYPSVTFYHEKHSYIFERPNRHLKIIHCVHYTLLHIIINKLECSSKLISVFVISCSRFSAPTEPVAGIDQDTDKDSRDSSPEIPLAEVCRLHRQRDAAGTRREEDVLMKVNVN